MKSMHSSLWPFLQSKVEMKDKAKVGSDNEIQVVKLKNKEKVGQITDKIKVE